MTGTHTIPVAAPPPVAATASTPSGSSGTPAPVASAPISNPNDLCAAVLTPGGTVTMTGLAPGLPSVSALLDSLRTDTDLSVLWVSTAAAPSAGAGGVQFTLTASLGSSARGHRLETFFRGAKCK